MHQRRWRARQPYHNPHARHGGRRTTNGLGYSSPTRRERVQQLRQRSHRTSQATMGTQTKLITPPASHPPLLVWHSFTTPPFQPLIPTDAYRVSSPRTSADPGRFFSRFRVQPRPTPPLASTLQLRDPPRGGTHLVHKARDGFWWLSKVAHRT